MPTIPKNRLRPSTALLERVERAFHDHGYGELSMLGLAKACDLSSRTLYYYFENKADALRSAVQYGNDVAMNAGIAAGRVQRENGGNALDILSEIVGVRFGTIRCKANTSPHLVEMNAEIFKRCNDIITAVALHFEAQLAKEIKELQWAKLLAVRTDLTADDVAQALANGARGINQRLPPIAPDDLPDSYREMCRFILYGCANVALSAEDAPTGLFAAKSSSGRS